jgi:hypothetical protein
MGNIFRGQEGQTHPGVDGDVAPAESEIGVKIIDKEFVVAEACLVPLEHTSSDEHTAHAALHDMYTTNKTQGLEFRV